MLKISLNKCNYIFISLIISLFILCRFCFFSLTPHVVSFLGVYFAALSIQKLDKKTFLKYQIITNFSFMVSLYYLNAWTGFILMAFALLRMIVYYYYESNKKEKNIFILFSFLLLFSLTTVFTYDGYISLVILLGFYIFTYGTWQSDRLVLLISAYCISVANILFNIYYMGYINVITELIMIASTSVALNKYFQSKKIYL